MTSRRPPHVAAEKPPVPISRIAEDFDLKTPAQTLDFIVRFGVPRGLHEGDDGRVHVPGRDYELYVSTVSWAAGLSPEPA